MTGGPGYRRDAECALPPADRLPVATVAARISTCARSIIIFRPGKTSVCGSISHRVHYEQARCHAGRAACPSVDGQSVKTTERGGARGFDAHERVKGRKRHILVDTFGLLVANRVEPADTSDRRAGALLLGGLSAFLSNVFPWRFVRGLCARP
jgi:hypothetical protein